MTFQTGCRRESPVISRETRKTRAFPYCAAGPLGDVLQSIRVRNQKQTPSCVGQSMAGVVEGITGLNGSATQIWTGARRREGNLHDSGMGCYVSSAIHEAMERGVAPYHDGEENDWGSFVRRASLQDELAADDHRISKLADYFVTDGSAEEQRAAIFAALSTKRGVIWTTGVREAFFSHPANVYVSDDEVGAGYNGHAMRIAGYCHEIDCFVGQNSWGESWGGVVAQGVQLPGCFLIRAELLIPSAWETWVIEVAP